MADWFTKRYGPRPLSLGIRLLDAVIIALFLLCLDLVVNSWIYVFS